jgi:hypothetical protein
MSINLHLRRVDATTLDRLLDDPTKIESFLLEIEPEQLDRLKADSSEARNFFMAPTGKRKSPEKQLDLAKNFHALHFLLTGSAEPTDTPASLLLLAGQPIGEVDVGYGPATAATPAEVTALASFLDEQSTSVVRQRFESEEIAESNVISEALSSATARRGSTSSWKMPRRFAPSSRRRERQAMVS